VEILALNEPFFARNHAGTDQGFTGHPCLGRSDQG
jgi:hypothetical protein